VNDKSLKELIMYLVGSTLAPLSEAKNSLHNGHKSTSLQPTHFLTMINGRKYSWREPLVEKPWARDDVMCVLKAFAFGLACSMGSD
jgi:hypothetical protein